MATVDPQYTYVQFTVNRPVYYFAQLSTELCTCGICNGIYVSYFKEKKSILKGSLHGIVLLKMQHMEKKKRPVIIVIIISHIIEL